MKESVTYVIHCKQGLNKQTCPFIQQIGHCCECNNVFYIRREPAPKEETSQTSENTEQKEND